MRVGLPEAQLGLRALTLVHIENPVEVRMALKAICAVDAEGFARFDDLFDAYWLNRGRHRRDTKHTPEKTPHSNNVNNLATMLSHRPSSEGDTMDQPDHAGANDEDEANHSGEGKLIASEVVHRNKTDLREFVLPEDRELAEKTALRIARACHYRLSRRRKAADRGARLDLRRIMRKSVATGGEPMQLLYKKRPDKPVHLVVLLDVSGSMQVYARVFLAFVKGLVGAWLRADAFLFHTSLMFVSEALRDKDTLRAVNRLSIMAQGFGGGTKIGKSLEQFNSQYQSKMVGRKTVVIIVSDGYDTGQPERVGAALAKLKKSGCKLIWLNPLKGWNDYQPIAASMQAALPHIDFFAPCNTLESLLALEPQLERL